MKSLGVEEKWTSSQTVNMLVDLRELSNGMNALLQ